MIKDIIIIDNFFDDVGSILKLANNQEYYKNSSMMTYWSGRRTVELLSYDFDTYSKIINNLINKVIDNSFGKEPDMTIKFNWNVKVHFHKMTEEVILIPENAYHKDSNCVYAGVVYLTENAPKNYGTIIKKDDSSIIVENIFNRLVLYRADLFHSPVGGFGTSYENDNRLTLTIYFEQLSISIDAA